MLASRFAARSAPGLAPAKIPLAREDDIGSRQFNVPTLEKPRGILIRTPMRTQISSKRLEWFLGPERLQEPS